MYLEYKVQHISKMGVYKKAGYIRPQLLQLLPSTLFYPTKNDRDLWPEFLAVVVQEIQGPIVHGNDEIYWLTIIFLAICVPQLFEVAIFRQG